MPNPREESEIAAAIKASLADQEESNQISVPNDTQVSGLTRMPTDRVNQKLQDAYHSLNADFPRMRNIRGDGNCYYRAVMYGVIEQMIISPDRAALFQQLIQTMTALKEKAPFDGQYAQALNALIEQLNQAKNGQRWQTIQDLEKDMRDPNSLCDHLLIRGARVLMADAMNDMELEEGIVADEDIANILAMRTDAEGAALNLSVLPKALGVSSELIMIQTNAPKVSAAGVANERDQQGERITMASNQDGTLGHPPIHVNVLLRSGHYDLIYSKDQVDKLLPFVNVAPKSPDFKQNAESIPVVSSGNDVLKGAMGIVNKMLQSKKGESLSITELVRYISDHSDEFNINMIQIIQDRIQDNLSRSVNQDDWIAISFQLDEIKEAMDAFKTPPKDPSRTLVFKQQLNALIDTHDLIHKQDENRSQEPAFQFSKK